MAWPVLLDTRDKVAVEMPYTTLALDSWEELVEGVSQLLVAVGDKDLGVADILGGHPELDGLNKPDIPPRLLVAEAGLENGEGSFLWRNDNADHQWPLLFVNVVGGVDSDTLPPAEGAVSLRFVCPENVSQVRLAVVIPVEANPTPAASLKSAELANEGADIREAIAVSKSTLLADIVDILVREKGNVAVAFVELVGHGASADRSVCAESLEEVFVFWPEALPPEKGVLAEAVRWRVAFVPEIDGPGGKPLAQVAISSLALNNDTEGTRAVAAC